MRISKGSQSIQRLQAGDRHPLPERKDEPRRHEVDFRQRRLEELHTRVAEIMEKYPFQIEAQDAALAALSARQGISPQTLYEFRRIYLADHNSRWIRPVGDYLTVKRS